MKIKREKQQIQQNSNIEDYFSTKATKFLYLLKTTSKWKELYNQAESKLAILLSVVVPIVLFWVYKNSEFNEFIGLIQNIIQTLIETSIGMLGFIISGLAIFTGTITNKLVKNVDSEGKANSIIGILFSFYLVGVEIGLGIIFYFLMQFILTTNLSFSIIGFCIFAVMTSYLFLFSIFYSISLLGTCLRIFLVSYRYSKDEFDSDRLESLKAMLDKELITQEEYEAKRNEILDKM